MPATQSGTYELPGGPWDDGLAVDGNTSRVPLAITVGVSKNVPSVVAA